MSEHAPSQLPEVEPLPIPDSVPDALARLGIELPEAMMRPLAHYLALLLAVNQRFNLTGIREPENAWHRHIVDSLTLLPFLVDLPDDARVADVGSGGGLPGIPLAITQPTLQLTLLEATGKKAMFLTQVAEALGLDNVTVVQDRAERVGQDKHHRGAYHAVVCRAIGPAREMLEYTLPLARRGGVLLAMKGPNLEAELAGAERALDKLGAGELEIHPAYTEGFDRGELILVVQKARGSEKTYPRRPGLPRQDPL